MVFAGDLRDCNNIAEVDLAFLTLPCSEHSSLGNLEGNVMNELAIAAAKIVIQSKASAIFKMCQFILRANHGSL
jgi:DNA (cytosine-5)-methyltransferase 1